MSKIKREGKTAVLILAVILTIGAGYFASTKVEADNTAQTLPFSQNWTNGGLITVNDDWSLVPGIVGYRGDDLSTTISVDLQTVVADGAGTPIDVIANQSNPDTQTSGGIAEFDGIANPVVALQGSGTADIPHIVIHLNTTGVSNIQISYNALDIDSASEADQQINTQYRVGGTGDYANVPGGYIADASAEGATLVTPVSVTLPADANNQPLVEVRIMTTNAFGSDEWIGIDDISITGGGGPTPTPTPDANVDFDGDNKSDWVVTRPVGGLAEWYISASSNGAFTGAQWGLSTDRRIPADYDGDGKDDIAVWRPITTGQPSGNAYFYILQSSNNTVRVEDFGQQGDDPRVVADYDGDGADDVAVYRQNAGAQNFFYYRASSNNPGGATTFVPWGAGEFVRPHQGDYDGDGKADFVVVDQAGIFSLLRSSDSQIEYTDWGIGNEALVPGDFDGDGRDDYCVVRGEGSNFVWYILLRTGATRVVPWGLTDDRFAPGDYDGDGRQDVAVWRPSTGVFYVLNSSNSSLTAFQWGQTGDDPEANWYVHTGGTP